MILVSGWSSVIAATLCPHMMAQDHSCCDAMETDAQNKAMGDTQMPMPISEITGDTTDAIAAGQPAQPCPHCVNHSSVPASTIFAASVFEQSKRNISASAFQANSLLTTLISSFTTNVIPKQKAVPGAATERHVLFSVFRI